MSASRSQAKVFRFILTLPIAAIQAFAVTVEAQSITEFPLSLNSQPSGITTGGDAHLWFTEFNANKIGKLSVMGGLIEFFVTTPSSGPGGITSGPDGNLWFAYFTDTNGGNDTTPSNPLASHYAPLQQLQIDLGNHTVANYNWITPNQFNDMHNALPGGFNYDGTLYTGDQARIAQGDNFLKMIIPMIMASDAYKNDGAIVIWWDETESDGSGNANDFNHTIGEIVISPDAHPNVNGMPYVSPIDYTHSSDLLTMQEIFHVGPTGGIGDAANATDLADLFAPDAIPDGIPEPRTMPLTLLGLGLIGFAARRRTIA